MGHDRAPDLPYASNGAPVGAGVNERVSGTAISHHEPQINQTFFLHAGRSGYTSWLLGG